MWPEESVIAQRRSRNRASKSAATILSAATTADDRASRPRSAVHTVRLPPCGTQDDAAYCWHSPSFPVGGVFSNYAAPDR